MSEKSPENKERPNASELKPKKDRTETVKGLGRTAIRGSNR